MKKVAKTRIIRVKRSEESEEKENLIKRVRVEVDVPGQGSKFHEFEFCPIMYNCVFEEHTCRECPINGGICNFGLTENNPPEICPLKVGKVKMKFSLIEIPKKED